MSAEVTQSKVSSFAQALGWSEEEVLDLFREANERIKATEKTVDDANANEIRPRIEKMLNDMGLPKTHKGFSYLVYVIERVYEDKSLRKGFSRLYPEMSEKFRVSRGTLDYELHNAISFIWNEENAEVLKNYFGIHTESYIPKAPIKRRFVGDVVDLLNCELSV